MSQSCNSLLLLGRLGLLQLLDLELAVLGQLTGCAVGCGALLQGVVGDGDQLVALFLRIAELEPIEIVEGSTLMGGGGKVKRK